MNQEEREVTKPFRCFNLRQSSSMPAFDGAHIKIFRQSAFFCKQMSAQTVCTTSTMSQLLCRTETTDVQSHQCYLIPGPSSPGWKLNLAIQLLSVSTDMTTYNDKNTYREERHSTLGQYLEATLVT